MFKKRTIIVLALCFVAILFTLSIFFVTQTSKNDSNLERTILQTASKDSIAINFDIEFNKLLKEYNVFLKDSILETDINFISKKITVPKNKPFPILLVGIQKIIKDSKYSIINTQVSNDETNIDILIGYNGVVCNELHITKDVEEIKNIKVAVVVINFGLFELQDEVNLLKLPCKLNLAITPYFHRNDVILAEANSSRHEILINIPMEPKVFNRSSTNKIPRYIMKYGILARYNPSEIEEKLNQAYSFFDDKKLKPKGMTHLRGFKILRDFNMSKQVLDYCAYKKNYFLYTEEKDFDGVEDVAYTSGVNYYKYDEIIDQYGDTETTKNLLYKAVKSGAKKGSVIIVISPKKKSVEVLSNQLQMLKDSGVDFVFLSSITI